MLRFLQLFRLILREAGFPAELARTPEPGAMTSSASVVGFDEAGTTSLLPLYRFNALAISRLAAPGARILDLGCGSGRFLAYLATRRPDLKLVGLDLSEAMIDLGRRHLAEAGLEDRVSLVRGDMREFRRLLPAKPDIITSIFALHHLATQDDLVACLREINAVSSDDHALVWIFDHTRPHHLRTAEEVSKIFTPAASLAFRRNSYNSLCASWSFEELHAALRDTFAVAMTGAQSRLLPLYQIHWTAPCPQRAVGNAEWIEDDKLPPGVRTETQMLLRLFRTVLG